MQTFLPWDDIDASLDCLDRSRLGKQRVEALQLVRALTGATHGWRNHPAAKMWSKNISGLAWYGIRACDFWVDRGYNDTCRMKLIQACPEALDEGEDDLPWWFGQQDFHLSHRSNLVRKDPEYYRIFFGDIPDDLPYVWPSADVPA